MKRKDYLFTRTTTTPTFRDARMIMHDQSKEIREIFARESDSIRTEKDPINGTTRRGYVFSGWLNYNTVYVNASASPEGNIAKINAVIETKGLTGRILPKVKRTLDAYGFLEIKLPYQ
jgi:hypothetical protein